MTIMTFMALNIFPFIFNNLYLWLEMLDAERLVFCGFVRTFFGKIVVQNKKTNSVQNCETFLRKVRLTCKTERLHCVA